MVVKVIHKDGQRQKFKDAENVHIEEHVAIIEVGPKHERVINLDVIRDIDVQY